jgi:choline dehydrogenase-like flavoprotein
MVMKLREKPFRATSAAVNPSLTVAALALRAAERVRVELAP